MLKQRRLLHILEHPTYRAKEARQRGHGALERQEFGGFQQLQALGRAAEQQWPATRSARAIRQLLDYAVRALRRVGEPREKAAELWLLRHAECTDDQWHLFSNGRIGIAERTLEVLQHHREIVLAKLALVCLEQDGAQCAAGRETRL